MILVYLNLIITQWTQLNYYTYDIIYVNISKYLNIIIRYY